MEEVESCSICLDSISNHSIMNPCFHSFCFHCILQWIEVANRCPLCLVRVEYLIHDIKSPTEFSKYWPAARIEKKRSFETSRYQLSQRRSRTRSRPYTRNTIHDFSEDAAILRRRQIYNDGLRAKHFGTNKHTKFTSVTAATFSSNRELQQRVKSFVRRELKVFTFLDDESRDFLLQYVISIAKSLDLQSDRAIKMIGEMLGYDRAEHFVHEVVSFARSPFSDISRYDAFVQYVAVETNVEKKTEREMWKRTCMDVEDGKLLENKKVSLSIPSCPEFSTSSRSIDRNVGSYP